MVVSQSAVEPSHEPELNKVGPSSSFSGTGEVSVKFEKEVTGGDTGAELDIGGDDAVAAGGPVSNGTANFQLSSQLTWFADDRSLLGVHKLPPDISSFHKLELSSGQRRFNKLSDISSSNKLDSPSSQLRLEKSKTERPRRNNILAEDASQIFNKNMSVHEKLKLLNRIATVKNDGTVEFEIPADVEPSAYVAGSGKVQNACNDDPAGSAEPLCIPPLQIAMLIVGTRGDVQPFVAIGKPLQEHGHRVRLATHSNFKEFVLTAGLEFYPLGGDPKVLAEYMVKNKGFLPSGPSEIPVQRSQMKDIINSLLPACKEPDLDTGIPFRAEAIIANPPAYGRKKLKLRPVTYLSGSQGSESDIPHGYIWSPHLVPKPKDWGPKIDVVGFCFLDLASNYEPPVELVNWLKAGRSQSTLGLPVQQPEKMTQIIVQALEMTGQRGIINKGWVGLGNYEFVIHHGGAGTTAAGLKAACPTTIVPFFGDQPFWGERVHARGVGPSPIPVDQFTLPKLVDAIKFMLDPKVKERAVELAKAMEKEDGVDGAVKAFLRHLPREKPESDPPHPSSGLFSIQTALSLLHKELLLFPFVLTAHMQPALNSHTGYSSYRSFPLVRFILVFDEYAEPSRTTNCNTIKHLKQTHLQILINGLKDNNFLLHTLITVSANLISLDYAFNVLQTSISPNVVAYNTMIKCFVNDNNSLTKYNAMSVYKELKKRDFLVLPNSFTFTFLLKCFESLNIGRMIHGEILKMGFDSSSAFVGNALLNLYGKCASDGVDIACKVFDYMPVRDIVSWNTMIGMYMDCGEVGLAIRLFESMPERSVVTWNSVISGLAKNGNMEYARSMFDEMPEKNDVSWNCLISGYLKMGDLRNAEVVFNEMPVKSVVACTAIISGYTSIGDVESARKMFDQIGSKRNVVTWNAMISGYINKSLFEEALSLFHLMSVDGKCKPDQITLISIVSACSHLGSLENGKWIAFYINKNKIKLSTPLGNALIDMFAKCGDIESSKSVFNRMTNKCIITWTTMVSSLAVHGMCKEALALFNKLCDQGTKPDDVMFIAVLSACNHGGLVKEGKTIFNQMVHNFAIKPQIEHYGCMIDLLARSGDLDSAFRLTDNMDLEPNSVIWGTLLAACKLHGNSKLFERVTKKILDQEPSNPSYLTLVTNLSSSIGRWQDALSFRREMKQEGIEKVPGCSSIQIGDKVHEFIARDTSHMQRSDIYEILVFLNGHLWLQSDFEV
ncbi:hypothetical protein R6Q57_017560 [Mikania cordata]